MDQGRSSGGEHRLPLAEGAEIDQQHPLRRRRSPEWLFRTGRAESDMVQLMRQSVLELRRRLRWSDVEKDPRHRISAGEDKAIGPRLDLQIEPGMQHRARWQIRTGSRSRDVEVDALEGRQGGGKRRCAREQRVGHQERRERGIGERASHRGLALLEVDVPAGGKKPLPGRLCRFAAVALRRQDGEGSIGFVGHEADVETRRRRRWRGRRGGPGTRR